MRKRRTDRPGEHGPEAVPGASTEMAGMARAEGTEQRWGAWDALAAEVFLGIKEWRDQHPTATFVEIERALDERWAAVRARMLQDLALASRATTLPAHPAVSRPTCPACGGALVRRGEARRRLTVSHGKTVELTRAYAVCTTCGTGLFPPG